MQSWRHLPDLPEYDNETACRVTRLNALGSLFYHTAFILGRDKLALCHKPLCQTLEKEDLHLVVEWPRFHFKTTIVGEGLATWWALPFTERDEFEMRELGYGDEWIRWMKVAHDQDTSTLIVAGSDKNAILMGTDIDNHYHYNQMFRRTFPEIIPDGTSTWNNEMKVQNRKNKAGSLKTGTFHYRGAGGKIEGIHPLRCIEDDIWGLECTESEATGNAVKLYHKMLGGVLSDRPNLVIGNRWSVDDLNGFIRESDKKFQIETHSAEGGCCALHPSGQALFPEEWPLSKLAYQRERMGDFIYAHQFLNQAMAAEDIVFKPEWLRYYRFKQSNPSKPLDDPTNFLLVEHEVYNGKVRDDIDCGVLDLRIIVDPNHAGKRGRCAHAISVIGYDQETQRFYSLDEWSRSCGYRDFCEEIYATAYKWGLFDVFIETVAAQVYLKLYLEELNTRKSKRLRFHDLPFDNRAAAKDRRIESLEPYIRNEQFWMHQSHSIAKKQLLSYYRGKDTDVDLIDAIGYAPQLYNLIRKREVMASMRQRETDYLANTRDSQTGY